MKVEINIFILIIFYIINFYLFYRNIDFIVETFNKTFSTKNMRLNVKATTLQKIVSFQSIIVTTLMLFYLFNKNYVHNIVNKFNIQFSCKALKIIFSSFVISVFIFIFVISNSKMPFSSIIKKMNIEGFINMIDDKNNNGRIMQKMIDNDLIIHYPEIKSSPECCTKNEFYTTGCMCVEPEDIEFIKERGGNN